MSKLIACIIIMKNIEIKEKLNKIDFKNIYIKQSTLYYHLIVRVLMSVKLTFVGFFWRFAKFCIFVIDMKY